MTSTQRLKLGSGVRGPTLPEAVEVLAIVPLGESLKVIGRGLKSGLTYDPVLSPTQLDPLTISADQEPCPLWQMEQFRPFDGQ